PSQATSASLQATNTSKSLSLDPTYNTTSAMPFFKRSSKNQSTSAASTPAQTPRSSMQATRPNQTNTMTVEQALEMAMQKSMRNVPTGSILL
ncbi:hypothetical protein BGZ58_009450, partial [Dissophora ornata]